MIFGKLVRLFITFNVLWIILSTVLPYYFPYQCQLNSITGPELTNSDIYYVIAHPDDEVMFFAPSIIELSKPEYNNKLWLVCFSSGNAEGLGEIRKQELADSGRILGFDKNRIVLIDEEDKFPDSMSIFWDADDIANELKKIIISSTKKSTIITFDEQGVSDHPNHKSMFHGSEKFVKEHKIPLYKLNSFTRVEKYTSTLLSIKLLITKFLGNVKVIIVSEPIADVVHIFADLPSVILTIAAMCCAHKSQMEWFRWIWLMISRIVNFNELIRVA